MKVIIPITLICCISISCQSPESSSPIGDEIQIVDSIPIQEIEVAESTGEYQVEKVIGESAKKLTGDVEVMVIFTSNSNSEWTEMEKSEKLDLVNENMIWLKGWANKYGEDFNFRVSRYGGEYDEEIGYDGPDSQIAEKAIEEVVKLTISELVGQPEDFYASLGVDNLICVVFHKDKGRAWAFPTYLSNYFLEYCVIYERHRNGMECDNSVIGHEILHLFNGIDLYSDQESPEPKSLIDKWCNNDIMSRTGDLSNLRVSDFTAWKIGWLQEEKEYFREISFHY